MLVFHSSVIERMVRWQRALISLAAVVFGGVTIATSSARAGIITSGIYTASGSAGNATATVISDYPTFDITSAAKSFTSIGPLDYQFPVTPNGATVTYFVSEGVTNNTNQTWTDYHEQLGTGTDGNFAPGGTPVEFLLPTDATYTNPSFSNRSVTPSEIDYTGGAIAPGQAISLTFSITVPDISPAGPADFTLRQFPTVVPEPGTLGLLAVGSISLLARRRRA
jgi:hypothetical protein